MRNRFELLLLLLILGGGFLANQARMPHWFFYALMLAVLAGSRWLAPEWFTSGWFKAFWMLGIGVGAIGLALELVPM